MAWINVKDQLPHRDQEDVLAVFIGWDDMEFYRTLEYDHGEKEWLDWKGNIYNTVKAWMPIPEFTQ